MKYIILIIPLFISGCASNKNKNSGWKPNYYSSQYHCPYSGILSK